LALLVALLIKIEFIAWSPWLRPGRASSCRVRVVLTDHNDNAPCFRAVEYRLSIRANMAAGSPLTQIQASDADAGANGRVTYALYSEARLPLVDVLEVRRLMDVWRRGVWLVSTL